MWFKWSFPITIALLLLATGNSLPLEGDGQVSWLHQLRLLRSGIKQCEMDSKRGPWDCFKVSSLRVFDRLLQDSPAIPVWYGVQFVRELGPVAASSRIDSELGNDLGQHSWFDAMARRLARSFDTHHLQINLKEFTNGWMSILERNATNSTMSVGTGRFRRHRYNMLITMVFGVTALGAVLVPLGFQMLSIVSGKALLLAKMALLLASINGLKRVANSGVHYGLYHVPGEHYNGLYDRGDVHHPRNVLMSQPLEEIMGTRRNFPERSFGTTKI